MFIVTLLESFDLVITFLSSLKISIDGMAYDKINVCIFT